MTDFDRKFDSYYNARRDYDLYRGIVDESENLSTGIYASIIRHEPTSTADLEDREDDDLSELTEVDITEMTESEEF